MDDIRPNFGEDPTYGQQRLMRMMDCLEDYMNDEDVDARQCYEDMLTCIEDNIKYHKKYLDKWNTLKGLMHGQRGMELITCVGNIDPTLGRTEFLTEKKACEEKYKDIPDRF